MHEIQYDSELYSVLRPCQDLKQEPAMRTSKAVKRA